MLILKVNFDNKKGYLYSLYRSEIPAPDEFDVFHANLANFSAEISSCDSHPHLVVIYVIIRQFQNKSKNVAH